MPPASVARACGGDRRRSARYFGRDYNYTGDQQQWSWAGRTKRHNGMAYPALRGANQLLNAAGTLAAFEALGNRLPITAQVGAQRAGPGRAAGPLPGACQGQPTLVLDVAHNPHAAATLAHNLDQMGFYPRTHAVFGAMGDKDTAAMLLKLRPLIDVWHFCDLPTPRAAPASRSGGPVAGLAAGRLDRADAGLAKVHADPSTALRAALESADPTDRIVIFGSFYTVGGVMVDGLPRLAAKHLG